MAIYKNTREAAEFIIKDNYKSRSEIPAVFARIIINKGMNEKYMIDYSLRDYSHFFKFENLSHEINKIIETLES